MPKIADYVGVISLNPNEGLKGLKNFDQGAKRAARNVESRFDKMSKNINKSFRRLVGVAALTAGLKGLAGNVAQVEASFISVRKTTNLPVEDIDALKDALFDLGKELPVSLQALAQIATVAGQLGISGKNDILKFTKAFAALEIASDRTISGEFGAQQFARFLGLSGAGTENADRMASAFTLLGNTSKFTEGQLLSTALEVSKISSKFKLTAQATLGISAALTELGVAPEVAATSIQKFFGAVNSASLDGKAINELSTITGLTAEEIENLRKSKPEEILDRFARGLEEGQRNGNTFTKELKALGLNGERSIKTFGALTVNVDRLTEQIRKSFLAYKENNAATKEAAIVAGSLESEWQKTKTAFQELADELSSGRLLNLMKGVLGVAQQLAKTLTAGSSNFGEFFGTLRNPFAKDAVVGTSNQPVNRIKNSPRQNAKISELNRRREAGENIGNGSSRRISAEEKAAALEKVREQIIIQEQSRLIRQQTINNTANTTNNSTVNVTAPITTTANPAQTANVIISKANSSLQQAAPQ